MADEAVTFAQRATDSATDRVATVAGRIRPLLELAGAETAAEALLLATRSDTWRGLRDSIAKASDELIQGGDGLSRQELEAEVIENPPANVGTLLEKVKSDLSDLNGRLTLLVQRRVTAEQTFSAINGHANAAIAEAKRQEALASMGEISEQYLEVATASRLLKWAIDKYRDQKQGPMLQRAGAVFSELTLGRFARLVVDHEKEPPALYARRDNGKSVEVAGLSEGTRDQLYLALRIAALELHLEHAKALPFIADDLFVNFDDARAKAGFTALRELSKRTQVLFLTHHEHLVPLAREVFGTNVNIIELQRESISVATTA